MPVIIRGLSGLSKKIKDATATPADIIGGKVAYGNDHTRMVGTHVCQPKIETITIKKNQETVITPKGAECFGRASHLAQLGGAQYADDWLRTLSVSKWHDSSAILCVSKDSDNIQGFHYHCTILKSIYTEVKYDSNTYLLLKLNGMSLHIYLGKPVYDKNYVEHSTFSCKYSIAFKNSNDKNTVIKYAGPGTTSGYYSSADAEIYLDIKNGIITEMGIAIRVYYPNVNKYYSEDDIELSIVHF